VDDGVEFLILIESGLNPQCPIKTLGEVAQGGLVGEVS
jgi:hypothetical protein